MDVANTATARPVDSADGTLEGYRLGGRPAVYAPMVLRPDGDLDCEALGLRLRRAECAPRAHPRRDGRGAAETEKARANRLVARLRAPGDEP